MHAFALSFTFAAAAMQTSSDAGVSAAAAANAAVALSPEVDSARVHLAETRALLEAARRSAPPQFIASQTEVPQSGSNGGTLEQSTTMIGATYSFTEGSQRGPAVEQARALVAAAEVGLQEAERTERVKATDKYYDALRASGEIAARRSQVDGAQRDLEAARIRYRAGDAPHVDVVRAEIDLARANAELDAAEVAAQNALDALTAETGIASSHFTPGAALAVPAMPASGEPALVAQALAHRSDLLAAREAVAVERAGVDVARRSGIPNFSVTAGYTQGTDSGFHIAGPNAALEVGVPIGGPTQARTDAQAARVQQAELRVAQIERDIRVEVAAAYRNAQAASRAVAGSDATERSARDELRAVEKGYAAGASSSLDVAEARRVDAQAAIAALDARYNEARARAHLLEVIGS